MNQFGNQPSKRPIPKFDPSDVALLKKLIDTFPRVKNVTDNSESIKELWHDLASEYNSYALECRDVSILRRKYKNMRDTIKKRMKESAKESGPNKRPRLDSDDLNRQSFDSQGGQGFNAAGSRFFSDNPSGLNRINNGPRSNIDAGINSYRTGPSSNTTAYEHLERNKYSPSRTNTNFKDSYNSSNNLQEQSNLNRDEPRSSNTAIQAHYDPFAVDKDNCSYPEEFDSINDSRFNLNQSIPTEMDVAIGQHRCDQLTAEMAYRKVEHTRFMTRMNQYHAVKMQAMTESIKHQKEKQSLEVEYLKLKIQQVHQALRHEHTNRTDDPFKGGATRPVGYTAEVDLTGDDIRTDLLENQTVGGGAKGINVLENSNDFSKDCSVK